MGSNCCKSEQGQEITEQDNYGNTYTCNQNSHEDIFKTRPPCWFGHQCSFVHATKEAHAFSN